MTDVGGRLTERSSELKVALAEARKIGQEWCARAVAAEGELQRLERIQQVHAEVINKYVQRAEAAESEVARLLEVLRHLDSLIIDRDWALRDIVRSELEH
jgi:hypothetical protein